MKNVYKDKQTVDCFVTVLANLRSIETENAKESPDKSFIASQLDYTATVIGEYAQTIWADEIKHMNSVNNNVIQMLGRASQ